MILEVGHSFKSILPKCLKMALKHAKDLEHVGVCYLHISDVSIFPLKHSALRCDEIRARTPNMDDMEEFMDDMLTFTPLALFIILLGAKSY